MANKKYIITIGIVVAVIAGVVSFLRVQAPQTEQTDKMEVAASFYPLYFFAAEIGGDTAMITNITPAGAEPHDYEPTAQDIARIERSRLLILNGAGLEPWGDRIRSTINPAETAVVSVSDGLAISNKDEQGKMIADPHIWLSPVLTQRIADIILTGFIKADPLHAADYEVNAIALKAKLANLDREYREGLRSCAEKNIITSHAAFGYLAAAYGLQEISIAGLSPDAEPSAADLGAITQFSKKNGIKYIFFESLASPKLSQTIAREIGARTLVLNPLEGLTGDEIAQGENYFTVMRDNLKNLQIALLCQS
ncbi:MAG: zinc ABC transporter substrate-binding protein [Candidatus Sungiibacteriota bacterium]